MSRSRRPVLVAPRRGRVMARLAAALVVGATLVVGQSAGAGAQVATDMEAAFGARVTAERQAQGRPALSTADDLVAVARAHSAEMAASNRLYHNALLGQQVQGWEVVGENVGVGASVDEIDRALMASPAHRADILDPRFTEIGIGVVRSGGSMWVTQVFRQRIASAAPVTATPSTVPVAAPPAPEVSADPPPARSPAPPHAASPPRLPRQLPRSRRLIAATAPTPATTEGPTTTTTTTTVSPPATSSPAAVAAEGSDGLDLGRLEVASAAALPARPDLGVAGAVAVALLWMVAAGVVRATLRRRVGAVARQPA